MLEKCKCLLSCRAKKAEKTTSKIPNTWETKFCCCSKRYTSSFVIPLNQKRFLERIGKKRVHVITVASKIIHTALNEAVKIVVRRENKLALYSW